MGFATPWPMGQWCMIVAFVNMGVKACLWTAKSCVVPSNVHTVSRLELMGSILLSNRVVVVEAIRKDWKLWVENRVQIVRKNVAPENWFYVPTDRNPSDLATRLKSPVCLKGRLLWWQGTDFLKSEKIVMLSQQFSESDVLPEQKSAVMSIVAKCEKVVGVGEVVDCCSFSSLRALLRIAGYVLRFIYNLKSKGISVKEVDENKKVWVKYEQYFIQKDTKNE